MNKKKTCNIIKKFIVYYSDGTWLKSFSCVGFYNKKIFKPTLGPLVPVNLSCETCRISPFSFLSCIIIIYIEGGNCKLRINLVINFIWIFWIPTGLAGNFFGKIPLRYRGKCHHRASKIQNIGVGEGGSDVHMHPYVSDWSWLKPQPYTI